MKIIELGDDDTVEGPGFYRCSMTHYHSQNICPGPSVSSTGVRKAALESPHAFWKTSALNENRYPEKEIGDSLILGRAAHALILGDEVFDDHFVYVPDDAPSRPTATQIAAYERDGEWSESAAPRAKFWEAFDEKAKGRLLLKQEQVQKIMWMSENLTASPQAVEVLTGDLIEVSMIWQDERTGLWVKSRPDCIPTNGADFGDLKTFAPKSKNLSIAAQRAVSDHGYALQMALAVEGMLNLTGQETSDCALIFIQTSEPYEVVPIQIEAETLYWCRVLIRDGLNKIAHGLETREWPMAVPGFEKYAFPPSMVERLSEMQFNKELPSL